MFKHINKDSSFIRSTASRLDPSLLESLQKAGWREKYLADIVLFKVAYGSIRSVYTTFFPKFCLTCYEGNPKRGYLSLNCFFSEKCC